MIKQQSSEGLIRKACSFWQQYQARKTDDENLFGAIERLVDIADPTIRRAKRYQKVLRDPMVEAMSYCASVIELVPGPILLSRQNYFDDPKVKALFVSPDDLNNVLHRSPEVNALRETGYVGEAVALMTMSKEEKTVFGHQKQGEMIVRDVAQRAVNFIDHRLVAPSADLAVARLGIVNRGLEVLATVAMEQITNLRTKSAELREKREFLKGAIRILSGKTRIQARFTIPDPSMAEQLLKAEQTLSAVEIELKEVVELLSYPEDSVRYLEEVLQRPSDVLTVQCQSINLNWMNVLVNSRIDTDGHEIPLAEFSLSESLRRYGVFVTFSLEI